MTKNKRENHVYPYVCHLQYSLFILVSTCLYLILYFLSSNNLFKYFLYCKSASNEFPLLFYSIWKSLYFTFVHLFFGRFCYWAWDNGYGIFSWEFTFTFFFFYYLKSIAPLSSGRLRLWWKSCCISIFFGCLQDFIF